MSYYNKLKYLLSKPQTLLNTMEKRNQFFLLGFLSFLLLSIPLTVITLSQEESTRQSASAATVQHTYYVSKSGSNGDGLSWATSWNELNKINWSVINPGDTIVIDGGSTSCASEYDFSNHAANRPGLNCGMLYTTPLTVAKSGTSTDPIRITLSSEPGHNGTAVFFGGRSNMLPNCNQTSYTPGGTALTTGVSVRGYEHIVIDGLKRSGIMVYGFVRGVSFANNATRYITVRNMEIFDNGSFGPDMGKTGYGTDEEGIELGGDNITMERLLIHDNGQDAIQDANGHAKFTSITLRDSWLYMRRDHPTYIGYSFAGGKEDTTQDCTHVDGVQIWDGGTDQSGFTVENVVFGPLLGQGFYPGDQGVTGFDNVIIRNSLFISARAQNINSDSANSVNNWTMQNITSYEADGNAGAIDITGSGHTLQNSIFYGGYASANGVSNGSGNIYYNTDAVTGGTNTNPQFVGILPGVSNPTYAQLASINFTPQCSVCAGKGSSLHSIQDIRNVIDSKNMSLPSTMPTNVLPTAAPTTVPPTATRIPLPSSTPIPTNTPVPTSTPVPPTITPTRVPTTAPTKAPTATRVPVNTTITLNAISGSIRRPFKVVNSNPSYIYQTSDASSPSEGGRASFSFSVASAGNYTVSMIVSAPNDGANSVWINIDDSLSDPLTIWDILPLTSSTSFSERIVSWRGNGSYNNNQYNPKIFVLSSGTHTLTIRGREADVKIQAIIIKKV